MYWVNEGRGHSAADRDWSNSCRQGKIDMKLMWCHMIRLWLRRHEFKFELTANCNDKWRKCIGICVRCVIRNRRLKRFGHVEYKEDDWWKHARLKEWKCRGRETRRDWYHTKMNVEEEWNSFHVNHLTCICMNKRMLKQWCHWWWWVIAYSSQLAWWANYRHCKYLL